MSGTSRNNNTYEAPTNGSDSASAMPSMKISSKISYGELFIRQFNKNGAKEVPSSPESQPTPNTNQPQKLEQQKSSRRTTSLLNLFMSNSQGKNNYAFKFFFFFV